MNDDDFHPRKEEYSIFLGRFIKQKKLNGANSTLLERESVATLI